MKYFSKYFPSLIILALKAVTVGTTIIAKQTQTSFAKFSKTFEKMFNMHFIVLNHSPKANLFGMFVT